MPSAKLIEAAKLLEADEYAGRYPWRKHLLSQKNNKLYKRPSEEDDILHDDDDQIVPFPNDGGREGFPKVFHGKIASANILLKDKTVRRNLHKAGARAAEMEASGVADAAWNHAVGYFVVRGICDYGDIYKCDTWQAYAALAAAAYTRALIEKLPNA